MSMSITLNFTWIPRARWEGDRQFYDGVFLSYDSETNTYSVDYDDGDDDPSIELRKYKVDYKDERISVVTVLEHNLDDTDEDETSKRLDIMSFGCLYVHV